MSSLTIGYSTLADSLENIQLPDLAKHLNWDVLITVQSGTEAMPTAEQLAKAPSGDRVKVLAYSGSGVTKIRNKVLENASGEYLIFADDDIVFNEEGLSGAIQIMKAQQLTLLLGQAVDDLGTLRKQYPVSKTALTKFNSGKAATYEMVVDVSAVRSSGVRFDEDFGAGAEENYLGDEYIFIADLLSAGLVCQFEPIVLATHPTDSSGSGWGTKRDRIARARIFDRVFKGNKTLPFMARAAFGARKIGKGLTLRTWLLFTFGK
jgi:glycosyltransferase involved in cell wall biosynthesis